MLAGLGLLVPNAVFSVLMAFWFTESPAWWTTLILILLGAMFLSERFTGMLRSTVIVPFCVVFTFWRPESPTWWATLILIFVFMDKPRVCNNLIVLMLKRPLGYSGCVWQPNHLDLKEAITQMQTGGMCTSMRCIRW